MGLSSTSSIDDVVIVGGGLAGLFCALKLAPRPVTILSATPLGAASSASNQNGLPATPSADAIERYVAETLAAGGGLADAPVARLMATQAAKRIEDLHRFGVAADDSCAAIAAALVAAIRRTPSIRVMEGFVAEQLRSDGHDVTGLVARDRRGGLSDRQRFPTRAVVLATGGVGHLYSLTNNPPEARGDGLAMAALAGALLADLEFVAFHPTQGAEHHIGGVHVDARGRTTLDGLWACGEVAATGAHGASQFAGNALLEALVVAARVAEDIRGLLPTARTTRWSDSQDIEAPLRAEADDEAMRKLRATMTRHVGAVRDHAGLTQALRTIEDLAERTHGPDGRNALIAAKLIATAALSRRESRGVHRRNDFPAADPRLAKRAFVTLQQASAAAAIATMPLDLAS